MSVHLVRIGISSLIEEIEIWLRIRIEAELKKVHGTIWWLEIPGDIRRRAERRHALACSEYGVRRAGPAHSVSWLSFGDTLKLLDKFERDFWVRCLNATVYYKPAFSRTTRKLKAFRDNRIAHLQSGGPTAAEITKVLASVDKLCEILRPQDYILSKVARKALLSPFFGNKRRLLFDLYEPTRTRKRGLSYAARLRALDRIVPPSKDIPRSLELRYYDEFLFCCAEAGGTISSFIGEPEVPSGSE